MVLATYRSLSHKIHHLVAQTKLACQSSIPGIDIHSCQLCSPAITISKTTVHSTKASHLKLQRIQDISAKESEVIFFLKKKRERKKREAHSPFQVANYGVQISSNGKPSTSYPPKTPCSMKPRFG
jgi:hypothetical protein